MTYNLPVTLPAISVHSLLFCMSIILEFYQNTILLSCIRNGLLLDTNQQLGIHPNNVGVTKRKALLRGLPKVPAGIRSTISILRGASQILRLF